jgi:SAM-dependent methyltransferase
MKSNRLSLSSVTLFGALLCTSTAAWSQTSPVSPATQTAGNSWDAAYLEKTPSFSTEPSAFLVDMTKDLKPGTALDVGMGQGRNALYLAKQGWATTGFDVSGVGVTQALEQARTLGVQLVGLQQSAEEFDWGTERWDLVVLAYFPGLRRSLPKILESLKPGGVVLVEAYHSDAAIDRPPGPGAGVTFASNELLALFAGLRVLRYEDVRARADWGLFDTRLVKMFVQKPAAAGMR